MAQGGLTLELMRRYGELMVQRPATTVRWEGIQALENNSTVGTYLGITRTPEFVSFWAANDPDLWIDVGL